jgi:hypothetical protein
MSTPPCTCDLWNFPHRHTRACDTYAAAQWQEEHDTLEDRRLDDPQHGQADSINARRYKCTHS